MKFPTFYDINNESPSLFQHNYDKFIIDLVNLLKDELGVAYDRAIHIASIVGKAYNRPEVHYHTFHHVNMIYEFAHLNEITLETYEKLAIAFHDVIYYVRSDLNEANSALFMKSMLGGIVDPQILGTAACTITETGKHMNDRVVIDSHKVMDLDLYSLALPWEDFLVANESINKEYSKVLTQEEFMKRRKNFLELFLKKDYIYRTPLFRTKLEAPARRNIEQYILVIS